MPFALLRRSSGVSFEVKEKGAARFSISSPGFEREGGQDVDDCHALGVFGLLKKRAHRPHTGIQMDSTGPGAVEFSIQYRARTHARTGEVI